MKILFGKKPKDNESGAMMYIDRGLVFFKCQDFDIEDNRKYHYNGEFELEDYKKAIENLMTDGRAELSGKNYSLFIIKDNGEVHLRFEGKPMPCNSPGGTTIMGSINITCKLEDLVI